MGRQVNRTILSCLLTLACSAGITSTTHAQTTHYEGSRIFWDTASQRIVFANGGYARLIELADGRLMATSEHAGINIAFSSDKGNTWSSPVRIATNPAGIAECVPDLIQLRNGTIIVAYNPRPTAPYSPERRFGIVLKRSIDGGQTWGEEITVYQGDYTFENGVWEPQLIELPSGELQLYFADESPYTSNNDQQISLCRSFDGGLTWQSPERVSYRQGSRDGMPAAVLLADGKTLAIAIEDNGWPGVGDFIPTIVTCPLSSNWHNNWVDASSPRRWKAFNPDFVPSNVKGGAPYLRVLRSGETLLSHQTRVSGQWNLNVYVGTPEAKDFKAMSSPFILAASENAMWNSVSVIDTGTVVAVAPISGRVEMIKGRAVSRIIAPTGTPRVDATISRGEGYASPTASQLILGRQTGTRFTADFAAGADSLYFIARVSDVTPFAQGGSYGDGVTLTLDTRNAGGNTPTEGCFRLFFRLDGTMQILLGNNTSTSWQKTAPGDTLDTHFRVSRTARAYVIEAAIPWDRLSVAQPYNITMRANVIMQDRRPENEVPLYEMIPDARRDEPWTWMPLDLPPIPTAIGGVWSHPQTTFGVRYHQGIVTAIPAEGQTIRTITVTPTDGSRSVRSQGASVRIFPLAGPVIISVTTSTGVRAAKTYILNP